MGIYWRLSLRCWVAVTRALHWLHEQVRERQWYATLRAMGLTKAEAREVRRQSAELGKKLQAIVEAANPAQAEVVTGWWTGERGSA